MKIQECIYKQFKKYFLNTSIPCNSLFITAITEHIGAPCSIEERTKEYIIISLLFEDMPMVVKCNFRNTESVTKFISSVEIVG